MKWLFCILIVSPFLTCTNTNNLKVKDEVIKISEAYNKSICKTPYATKIIYSEKARHNGKYVMFNHATGYMLSMGYDCEIPIDNFNFLFTNFCKSFRKAEWLQYLKYLYASTPVKYQTDIAPGYNSAISCFRGFELHGPLDETSLSDFKYSELIRGNDGIKSLKFKTSIAYRNFEGTLFYNAENYRIFKIVLDRCDFYSDVFNKFDLANVTINYSYINNFCYLFSVGIDFSHQKLEQFITIQVLGQPSSPFVLDKNEWNNLSINDVCPIIEYNDKILPKSFSYGDIDTIRLDLETNGKNLEKQFFENNREVYYKYVLKDGSKSDEIGIDEYSKLKNKIIEKLKSL
ncbi:MAG: hypothetical protein NT144_13630 [Bacteroidia bacterium]|nr:hypothetical protein [Bacteroidia bacterium]